MEPYQSFATDDFDGDGFHDIVFTMSPETGPVYMHFNKFSNRNVVLLREYTYRPGKLDQPAIIDYDEDGNIDVFVGFNDSDSLYIGHFRDKSSRPDYTPLFGCPKYFSAKYGWVGNLIVCDESVDLDDDGNRDIIIRCKSSVNMYPRGVMGYSPPLKRVLWYFPTPGPLNQNPTLVITEQDTSIIAATSNPYNPRKVSFTTTNTYAILKFGKNLIDTVFITDSVLDSNHENMVHYSDRSYLYSISKHGKLNWYKEMGLGYSNCSYFTLTNSNQKSHFAVKRMYSGELLDPKDSQGEGDRKVVYKIDIRSGDFLDSLEFPVKSWFSRMSVDWENAIVICDTVESKIEFFDAEFQLSKQIIFPKPIIKIRIFKKGAKIEGPAYMVSFRDGSAKLYNAGFSNGIEIKDPQIIRSNLYPVQADSNSILIYARTQPLEESSIYLYDKKPGFFEYYGIAGGLMIPGILLILISIFGIRLLPPFLSLPASDIILDSKGRLIKYSRYIEELWSEDNLTLRADFDSFCTSHNLTQLQQYLKSFKNHILEDNFHPVSFESDHFFMINNAFRYRRLQYQMVPLRNWFKKNKSYISIEITDQTRDYLFRTIQSTHQSLFHVSHSTKNQLAIVRASLDRFFEENQIAQTAPVRDKTMLDISKIIDLNMKAIHSSSIAQADLDSKDEEICVGDICKQIFDMILDNFGNNVEMKKDTFESEMVKINRQLFREAVYNIVENAVQASPQNLKVQVNAELVKESKADFLKISIKDFGKGINDSQLVKIFLPNYTTREHKGGTGLGLTRSLLIICSHDGELLVNSSEEEGTQFSILIPVSSEIRGNNNG